MGRRKFLFHCPAECGEESDVTSSNLSGCVCVKVNCGVCDVSVCMCASFVSQFPMHLRACRKKTSNTVHHTLPFFRSPLLLPVELFTWLALVMSFSQQDIKPVTNCHLMICPVSMTEFYYPLWDPVLTLLKSPLLVLWCIRFLLSSCFLFVPFCLLILCPPVVLIIHEPRFLCKDIVALEYFVFASELMYCIMYDINPALWVYNLTQLRELLNNGLINVALSTSPSSLSYPISICEA